MGKFKIGDIVKGTKGSYNVTNEDMLQGRVICTEDDFGIDVEIIEHVNSGFVGEVYYSLNEEKFDFVKPAIDLSIIDIQEDKTGTYITVDKKYTIFTPASAEEISIVNVDDIEKNIETATKLALANIK